jgi:hypothetical protein
MRERVEGSWGLEVLRVEIIGSGFLVYLRDFMRAASAAAVRLWRFTAPRA